MNFKGHKTHEIIQMPMYDWAFSKMDELVCGSIWWVEDQVWLGIGGGAIDEAIFYKLVEYRFDK